MIVDIYRAKGGALNGICTGCLSFMYCKYIEPLRALELPSEKFHITFNCPDYKNDVIQEQGD